MRSIGIGEIVWKIIGRPIVTAISEDIHTAAGPLQVCAGHLSGCEAAVHAVHQVFEHLETEVAILVDACNPCNALNCRVALRNISDLCPPLSKILTNTSN